MTWLAAFDAWAEAWLGARAFRIVRYLIAGGTAAASHLAIFFVLVQFGHLYYLHASIVGFVMAIVVSFAMQKFWTFRDTPLHDVHMQFSRYAAVVFTNLLLNTMLVYLFVEKIGMWYLPAQIIATIIIAITGYFGYRHFVFRERAVTVPS
jgi:putative flippase GtrA